MLTTVMNTIVTTMKTDDDDADDADDDDEVQKRKSIGNRYINLLKDKQLKLPVIREGRTSVFAQFTVQSDKRDKLMQLLNGNDVPTAIHYPTPLHLQEC